MACGPVKQLYKKKLAQELEGLIQRGAGNYTFLSIGKTTPWGNESVPPTSTDTVEEEVSFWRECIAHKRILQSDISFVVPRFNWASGQVYDAYRDDVDLFDDEVDVRFYVLVDKRNIYKCIDNNNGVQSTEKPTETTPTIFRTSDGYRWKFMGTVPETKDKFLTNDFMPIEFVNAEEVDSADPLAKQLVVQNAAVDGSIDFVEITEVGDAYQRAILDSLSNTIESKVSNTVYSINSDIISRVDGAYINFSIKVTDATSTNFGEIRRITAYDGSSRQITIESAFTNPDDLVGYTFSIIPSAIVYGDGTGCQLEVQLDSENFRVSSIEVVDSGQDYSFATVGVLPTPTVGSQFGGTTTGIKTLAEPIISPPGGHGSNIINELGAAKIMIAVDYDRDEDGTLSENHDFRQFALIFNPLLRETTTKAGTEEIVVQKYSVFSTANITEFDGLATAGKRIIGNVSNNSGLFRDFNFVIGDFRRGTLDLQNTNNPLQAGDTLVIADPDFTDGSVTPIKITSYDVEQLATNKTLYRQTHQMVIRDTGSNLTDTTFEEDTLIQGSVSGATGIVASWKRTFITGGTFSVNEGTLELVDVNGTFLEGENLTLVGSSVTKGNIDTISFPEFEYRSGELLYIENVQVVERDDDQREVFKIVLEI